VTIFPSEELIGQIPEVKHLILQRDTAHQEFSSCKTVEERKQQRLYTIKGILECMIFEIKCAFQLFASRPVDPETKMLLLQSPTFLERFRCGTLKQIFDMPIFHSDDYKTFQSLVKLSENNHFDTLTILSQPSATTSETTLTDKICPVLNVITLQVNGTAIQNQQIFQNQELLLRNQERLMNQVMCQQSTVGRTQIIGGNVPFLIPPFNNQNRAMRDSSVLPSPIQIVPNVEDDTLVRGHGRRKNKRAIPEEERLRAEVQSGIPRPALKNSDAWCKTLADFWKMYKNYWEPLENEHGCKWRTDEPVLLEGGTKKTRISNARAAWWSRRKGMYDFLLLAKQYFITKNPGLMESEAELEALKVGEDIFNSVPASCKGHRKIDDINSAFRQALGENNKKGRPRRDDPFAMAFDDVPIDPMVMMTDFMAAREENGADK
jgi:hypothetical protein